ncbi:MAG: hypothetical protein ACOC7X_01145 [Spirochaetota bacterium]
MGVCLWCSCRRIYCRHRLSAVLSAE